MAVVIDVILTITVVALTPGTITEFQFRIADIGSSADSAAMCVGRLSCGFIGSVRAVIKLDDFGFFLRLFSEDPPYTDSPIHGNYIQHILSEEKEVVSQ